MKNRFASIFIPGYWLTLVRWLASLGYKSGSLPAGDGISDVIFSLLLLLVIDANTRNTRHLNFNFHPGIG